MIMVTDAVVDPWTRDKKEAQTNDDPFLVRSRCKLNNDELCLALVEHTFCKNEMNQAVRS